MLPCGFEVLTVLPVLIFFTAVTLKVLMCMLSSASRETGREQLRQIGSSLLPSHFLLGVLLTTSLLLSFIQGYCCFACMRAELFLDLSSCS